MDDNSQYLELFFEETEDNLQKLNESVLLLEQEPSDKSILDEIFRSAHTLKGMAATMGYKDMAGLTHQLENVFSELKQSDTPADEESITIVFQSLDALSMMLENIRNGGVEQVDYGDIAVMCDRVVARLRQEEGTGGQVPEEPVQAVPLSTHMDSLGDTERKTIFASKENGYTAYAVAVRIEETSFMKNVRAFMVLKNLRGVGEIVKTEPAAEVIENEDFGTDFRVLYLSPLQGEVVKKKIMEVSEVAEAVVERFGEKKEEPAVEVVEQAPTHEVVAKVKPSSGGNHTLRVDSQKIDTFMNLMEELVIYRNQLDSISERLGNEQVQEKLGHITRIVSDLQSQVISIRMQPLKAVTSRFPRMVRDLSSQLGKDIAFILEGEETELDRTVISEIGEPLIHLLRNSCDHGIETPEERVWLGKKPQGTVRLAAYAEGNRVVITVSDDGKGLDPEILKKSAEKKGIPTAGLTKQELQELIFHPGFSTAEQVTNVSGRGVGMDAVKAKIRELDGSIEVISTVGEGSTFRLSLPLTLSIIQSLIVRIGWTEYALPLSIVKKVVRITPENTRTTYHGDVYLEEGRTIPVISLAERFALDEAEKEETYYILAAVNGKEYALAINSFVGQKEIVIKKLGPELGEDLPYLGAAVMGDGGIQLILDVSTICKERTSVREA